MVCEPFQKIRCPNFSEVELLVLSTEVSKRKRNETSVDPVTQLLHNCTALLMSTTLLGNLSSFLAFSCNTLVTLFKILLTLA